MAFRHTVTLVFTSAALAVLGTPSAHSVEVQPLGLYGCSAVRIGKVGGHSYCSGGGTSGVHRVVLWCDPPWSANPLTLYGNWQVAGHFSTKYCGSGNGPAVQAQYELSN